MIMRVHFHRSPDASFCGLPLRARSPSILVGSYFFMCENIYSSSTWIPSLYVFLPCVTSRSFYIFIFNKVPAFGLYNKRAVVRLVVSKLSGHGTYLFFTSLYKHVAIPKTINFGLKERSFSRLCTVNCGFKITRRPAANNVHSIIRCFTLIAVWWHR